MADHESVEISLSAEHEQFVRSQVASGRYGSASAVVSEAIRLLEEAEVRQLLEKWLSDGLTPEEEAALPPGLLESAKRRVEAFVNEGLDDFRHGRFVDGPEMMERIRKDLEARRLRESA